MIKKIPMIIGGAERDTSEHEYRELTLNSYKVSIPIINQDDVEAIKLQNVENNLNINQIVNFLYTVGQKWKSENYSRRLTYIRDLIRFLGYSSEMAKLEANWISMILSSKSALYDIVETDLGSRHIVDEWLPQGDCYVKAMPKGKSVHLLAGNVPLSGVTSIIRAILTKNECIIKTSSADPFTAIALASSFIDTDEHHPISRSMSVMYWSHSEDIVIPQQIMNCADVVVSWGGHDAIKWAIEHTPVNVDILKFGPKKSIAIVDDPVDITASAIGVAHDICFYDQQACFSTQDIYYIGDNIDAFFDELVEQLDIYMEILPKGDQTFDEKASFSLIEKECQFAKYKVEKGDNQSWLLVKSPLGSFGNQPLARSAYIHHVSDISEITPYIENRITQTVTVTPWESSFKYRDVLASHGAERIVESGMNNIFRVGGAHDGMRPLQRLVKYISHERPSTYTTKDVAVKIEQTRYLEEDKFLVFVP
ncbi:acyl-CoA reductase [Photobacterium phosphoreum]|jgi:long-chain-fatty-acyl-CoA reductase|uniref:long-chain-fatty-acyl-CoA reductase LuxC n=1 Tax=Photobacterium phosphoreum TaxID=659 RepID=UPI000D183EAD|nr:acyl-CoA reductase [Photobacterium phosphoreum]MCD9510694.1 acyl-CoA reductase [Photobacterium phosphoreum]PSU84845.1 acyl-CoA reductase [Photobacterium phosphoreum]